jgi:hypothetical protein
MHRFLFITFLILTGAVNANAQLDTVKLNQAPMYGHILTSDRHKHHKSQNIKHGEDVYAKESSNVYTILPGSVSATFKIGQDNYVIVNTGDIYIVYAQLQSCLFKKGDVVDQNTLLGYANFSEGDDAFKINVQAWRTKKGAAKEDRKLLLALVK